MQCYAVLVNARYLYVVHTYVDPLTASDWFPASCLVGACRRDRYLLLCLTQKVLKKQELTATLRMLWDEGLLVSIFSVQRP